MYRPEGFARAVEQSPCGRARGGSRLIAARATPAELRGERLFHGKAQCSQCRTGPAYVDDYLHDLRVKRFYAGRAL